MKRGESASFHTSTMTALGWKDKRDVTMMSTIHKPEFEVHKIDHRTCNHANVFLDVLIFRKLLAYRTRSYKIRLAVKGIKIIFKWIFLN